MRLVGEALLRVLIGGGGVNAGAKFENGSTFLILHENLPRAI